MDHIDRRIIAELQKDATLSVAQIAERVSLTQTPCWKRIQKLEQAGVILGRVALIAPESIGLGLTVFVAIEAPDHSPAWRDNFAGKVRVMPEVLEIYRMAGETDYMLKVVTSDMASFDAFYRKLTEAVSPKNVSSHFSMERIKSSTAYPVETVGR